MDANSGRLTASVWKYFARHERDSSKYSKCLLCGVELRGHRSGNAKKHLLSTRHRKELPEDVLTSLTGARKKPLKDEIKKLLAKKATLLAQVQALQEHVESTAVISTMAEVSEPRAKRRAQQDPARRQEQNRENTRRWRGRNAQKTLLENEIRELERIKHLAIKRSQSESDDRNNAFVARNRLSSPAVGVPCGQWTLKACEQIHMLIAELFELAKSESAGALFVVFNKATANSATDPALHGVSYAYGSLNSVLCSAKGRAVVATFLDGPTTYGSRVQLTTVPMPAYGAGCLPDITASPANGSVCYRHMGARWANANYDFILTELLSFLGVNNAFQLASSTSLLRSTWYFSAGWEVQNFDINAHSEWYYAFYLQNRMNVYQYLIDKRAVLDYLARWCPFPGWEKHCSVPQQNLVAYSDKIVLPGDAEVMQLIRYHAEMDLSFFKQGRLSGFVFDYGYQRLGGVFLSFDKASKTIAIDYPFVRCDAKRSNFLMRLLAHFIRAKGYYPQYKWIKRVIPSFLAKYFEPLLVSTKVERIDDVGGALGFPPKVLIQYTWQISELLKLLA